MITFHINKGYLGSDIRTRYKLRKRAQVGVEVQQCEFFFVYIAKEKAWVTDRSTLDTSIDFDVLHVISDTRIKKPKFECREPSTGFRLQLDSFSTWSSAI